MIQEAMHFTVGRICEEVGTNLELTFNKAVIATIADVVNSQLEVYSDDLIAFSKYKEYQLL